MMMSSCLINPFLRSSRNVQTTKKEGLGVSLHLISDGLGEATQEGLKEER
ncbi:hypothetical protein Scep_023755 [Stephania cephalantha]|uniref:Uncharacterized protein n=1 Tax=Stephania cephalantha TaxID=152367 RepID=A0AAP0EY11_9MAGN